MVRKSTDRLYFVPVFAGTLCLSAFLLFFMQPMFSKMILPLLGGAPAVWNTAMVFFQAMLLAGYGYAHIISRLPVRTQAAAHILLLVIFSSFLPVAVPAGWADPPETNNPALWQLMMMAVAVGGPFFVLSGTAPMIQNWFSRTGHADAHNPYFLYAASNLGSMTALFAYPFVVEPLLALKQQSLSWAGGYAVLIAFIVLCAALSGRGPERKPKASSNAANDDAPTPGRILLWLILSFVPSSLMLGVTSFISTDLASVPLLWIIPLALYVGTFIIAFARIQPVSLKTVFLAQTALLAFIILLQISLFDLEYLRFSGLHPKLVLMAVHLSLFFLTALACHMQLAQVRPSATHLTKFYLIMSTGGVLGGIFNALIAPWIFNLPLEYPLVLGMAVFFRFMDDPSQSWTALRKKMNLDRLVLFLAWPLTAAFVSLLVLTLNAGPVGVAGAVFIAAILFLAWRKRWIFALTITALLLFYPAYSLRTGGKTLYLDRNFFGVMRVLEDESIRAFIHGTTMHGAQPVAEPFKLVPITYYYTLNPVGNIFGVMDSRPFPQNIAVLGLGIAGIVCYTKPGRHYDFYEIDPDVARIAEDTNLFTYLSDCGSPYDIIIGDARLKISKAPDQSYDLIVMDAFSSDNIPIHLITLEAFQLYLKKLKPGGLIAVNISNQYLDLEPVVAAAARELGMQALFKRRRGGMIEGTEIPYAGSIFAILAPPGSSLGPFANFSNWENEVVPSPRAWKDDYSNLVGAIRAALPDAHE